MKWDIYVAFREVGAVRNKSLVLEFPDISEELYSHFLCVVIMTVTAVFIVI